ncbi:MAG: nucleotidyltransferase family protein [Deltaproteobacteria bacterium]|nr:nucleotidyltransferase family protein [Deltaproteobacteria bacterium]
MHSPHTMFTSVVLAADRGPNDPVAMAAGVPCKSLTQVGGKPMVLRVLDALAAAQQIDKRIICGPPKSVLKLEPELNALVKAGELNWFENQLTPSASAFHVLQSLPEETPVLLTTSDHALLSAKIIDYFCTEALASGCDVVAGVAHHEAVTAAYPDTRRTAIRMRDGAYCGCNLFAFLTPRSRLAANFWRQIEDQRKKPLRLIRVLGWVAVLRFLLGQLSLKQALDRLSRRLDFKAGVVFIPFPEAAIDVDTVNDWRLVEKLVSINDALSDNPAALKRKK